MGDAALRGMGDAALRARNAWPDPVPDWVRALAEECDARGSQAAVAKLIGMSSSVVNQVLGFKYEGDVAKVADRVRGALLAETVDCPGVGQPIRRDRCLKEQARKLDGANPVRIRIWRACRAGCPNSRVTKDSKR